MAKLPAFKKTQIKRAQDYAEQQTRQQSPGPTTSASAGSAGSVEPAGSAASPPPPSVLMASPYQPGLFKVSDTSIYP